MGDYRQQVVDAVVCAGSLVKDCDCGRTHFANGDWGDYEPGELEGLREKAKQMPSNFIEGDDSVHWGSFGGRDYVVGCPCEWVDKVEQHLLRIEPQAIQFYKEKAKAVAALAQRFSDDVKEL